MIDVDRARRTLENRYGTVTEVSNCVFRATDTYGSQTYAVRYFDLQDALETAAHDLGSYQDSLLGKDYFNLDAMPDLRWNYYLYFVTNEANWANASFANARAAVEADRQYARKHVISEDELESILAVRHFADELRSTPLDPLRVWTDVLGNHDLTFIIDDSVQVPAVVRKIESGEAAGLSALPSTPQLTEAERAATSHFLTSLEIVEFRPHPSQRTFDFRDVNLITGVNGSGKTSLLEAIEFLFCGKNRRGSKVPAGTAISGSFGSSQRLSVRRSISGNRLRARHLAWYGKAELRKLTLDDSFGKFNFLDTDAATRLSVETSGERIGKDLAQLLLGEEAVKTLDRFHRVLREISNARKMTANEASVQELRSREARRRVEELRDVPRESDQLFRKLEASLDGVGWNNLPPSKDVTGGLEESLERAVVNLRLLRNSGKGLPRDDVELEELLRRTRFGIQRVAGLHKEREEVLREQTRARERDEELVGRKQALEDLRAVVASGIEEHASRLSVLRASVGSLAGTVTEVEAAVADLSDMEVGDGTFDDAIAACMERVRAAQESEAEAKEALSDFESGQDAGRSLRQRLVHSARHVIAHTEETAQCPLCGTSFEEGELLRRIDASLEGRGERDGAVLRDAAETASRELEGATKQLNALEVFRGAMSAERETGVARAIAQASSLRQRLQSEEAELGLLERKIKSLEGQGIAIGRVVELRGRAGLSDSNISATAIAEALQATQQERTQMAGVAEGIATRVAALDGRLREEAETWAEAPLAEVDVVSVLEERGERIRETAGAVRELAELLALSESAGDAVVDASLVRASELATELRAALSQEESNLTMLQRETDMEKDAVDALAGLRVRLKRLKAAENIVEQLLAEHSEEALQEEVLRSNAAEIAATFARVHAPNEFDLHVEDGRVQIARRSDRAEIELNEMSSGQRAAYALSLFLAMNESLRNGPKVILFDDPVAHIDDINTLSFLDYLRDVALSGSRQLFFGTADTQLAGLFKHKFRFLGEERFRVFDLVRAEEHVS